MQVAGGNIGTGQGADVVLAGSCIKLLLHTPSRYNQAPDGCSLPGALAKTDLVRGKSLSPYDPAAIMFVVACDGTVY